MGSADRLVRVCLGTRRGLAALAGVALVDQFVVGHHRLCLHGIGDEVGHSLTAYVWAAAAAAVGFPVAMGPALVGGVAIDIDHVPLALGLAKAPPGTSRPVTHSLLVIVLLMMLARSDRRRRVTWASAAFGVGSHLCRDLGTGRVLLWWPLSKNSVGIPYASYVLTMGGMVLATALSPAGTPSSRSSAPRPVSASLSFRAQATASTRKRR